MVRQKFLVAEREAASAAFIGSVTCRRVIASANFSFVHSTVSFQRRNRI